MVWRGVGAGDLKKKNDGQTGGGGFVANHVPLFPLFPAHPLPFDKNNVLPWIFSLGANSKMGTIAGTRVLYTQYPARVTTSGLDHVTEFVPKFPRPFWSSKPERSLGFTSLFTY